MSVIFNRKELAKACDGIRRDLLDCLLSSECVKYERKTPRQCMGAEETTALECQRFKTALYNCKRTQVDMRARFRGKMDRDEDQKLK